MTGYLNSKNPGEKVTVTFIRDDSEQKADVVLDIFEVYEIEEIGVKVIDISKADLKKYGADSGVLIYKTTASSFTKNDLSGLLITKIDDQKVESIEEVESVISSRNSSEPMLVTFLSPNGREKTYVFR